jgi:methionyl-tRNA synthetase
MIENILLTTAISYTNSSHHIGHLIKLYYQILLSGDDI